MALWDMTAHWHACLILHYFYGAICIHWTLYFWWDVCLSLACYTAAKQEINTTHKMVISLCCFRFLFWVVCVCVHLWLVRVSVAASPNSVVAYQEAWSTLDLWSLIFMWYGIVIQMIWWLGDNWVYAFHMGNSYPNKVRTILKIDQRYSIVAALNCENDTIFPNRLLLIFWMILLGYIRKQPTQSLGVRHKWFRIANSHRSHCVSCRFCKWNWVEETVKCWACSETILQTLICLPVRLESYRSCLLIYSKPMTKSYLILVFLTCKAGNHTYRLVKAWIYVISYISDYVSQ